MATTGLFATHPQLHFPISMLLLWNKRSSLFFKWGLRKKTVNVSTLTYGTKNEVPTIIHNSHHSSHSEEMFIRVITHH
jgi:hypothetical protein